MHLKYIACLVTAMVVALAGCLRPPIAEAPTTVMVQATTDPQAPQVFSDPNGDAILTGVDVLQSTATVFASGPSLWADLRIQFAAAPFGQHAHEIIWCFNTDQNSSTGGACDSDSPLGTEFRLVLRGSPNALTDNNDFGFELNSTGYYGCMHGAFDWATNTLRVLIPVAWLSDDGRFSYAIVSATTDGSATDFAPDLIDFGDSRGYFQSQILGRSLPFEGVPLCGLAK